jgi:hypothetical protein
MFFDEQTTCSPRRSACRFAKRRSHSRLAGVHMVTYCKNCSHPNEADQQGRSKPWCAACGAGLADAGQRPEIQPAPARGNSNAIPPSLRSGIGSNSVRRRKPDSPMVVLAIGLVLIGFGITVVATTASSAINGWSSRNWPKTQGRVVRSWVVDYTSSKSAARSYQLNAIYRYEVSGKRYESNTVGFGKRLESGDHASGEEELAKVAAEGKTCTVYYDPDDPSLSCLVPGPSLFYLVFLPLLSMFFLFIGSVCTWGSAKQLLA